jgi:hypothetical protein
MIADSPDEVRVRVREQLLQGATQIKRKRHEASTIIVLADSE